MTEIVKETVEPTKNEHAITEAPINSNFKHIITLDEENDSEADSFADAYGSQVDAEENDPYDYNDYASNYESDYEELDEQKEIDLAQEKKVDNNTNISSDVQGQTLISSASSNDDISNVDEKPEISSTVESRTEISTENTTTSATSNDQGQNSISNTSSSDEVSNEKKIDEKTDTVISTITAQSRRENSSRTSSTDSFQTDVSEKENYNVSDHESDTSYEKDELEKGVKITDSGKEKLAIVTTEAESKPGSLEEVLPSTSDKSEDDSGEDKLGKSLDKNVNNLIEKTSNRSSEETEDKSGENNEIEEKSDKLSKKLVENSLTEIISETIVDNEVILESSGEFKNEKSDNIGSNVNYNGENLQNIPDHKPELLPINTRFSSFSSEYNQNVRDSMTESFTPKSSSFSSISMYQSVDFTNERENKDTILEKNALNRISVASLGENPELNDISLDDECSNIHDSPKEWNLSDWGFPKTPTSLKSISTFFSPRSTTSTVTSTSSKRTSSKSSSSSDSRRMSTVSMTSTGSNYDLLLARLERENQLLQEDPKAKRMSLQGIAELKASFERVQHEAQIDDGIDWGKLLI
jgi:hypothetical protein